MMVSPCASVSPSVKQRGVDTDLMGLTQDCSSQGDSGCLGLSFLFWEMEVTVPISPRGVGRLN